MTRRALAPALALFTALVVLRVSANALPDAWRLPAAWLSFLVIPAAIFALLRRGERSRVDIVVAGAAESVAVFCVGAAAAAIAGAGLARFVALHPIVVGAWGAALVARARGAAPAPPRRETAPPASARVRLLRGSAIALCAALVVIGVVRMRAPDFRMDVYDHAGAAARVAARDQIFSYELGDGSGGVRPDPRKGTWNTLLAALVADSGATPLAMWRSATLAAALLGALAFVRVSREFLGSAWPIGALFLLAAHEGGPSGAWFARSAYPGIVGGFLYAIFLAETLAALRGERAARATMLLLAAALPLVHLLAGLFGFLALFTLASVLWFGRARYAAPDRAFVFASIGSASLIVLIAAWRSAAAGPSMNLVQSELQGVLFLTGKLFVPEPRTLFERVGVIGLAGMIGALALSRRARHEPGVAWLVGLALLAALLISPVFATPIGTHLSYLLRRVPQLPLLPLVAAMALATCGAAAYGTRGRRRFAALLGAAILAVAPAQALVGAARIAARPASAAQSSEAREAEWAPDLLALAAGLPATARVATDPITSYSLYAHSLASPLVLPDQHSAPTDSGAVARLVDLARILSPWTAPAARHEILASRGVTHVLVNAALGSTIPTFGYPVSMENARLLIEQLRRQERAYRLVASSGSLSLFEFDRAAGAPAIPPPRNEFLVERGASTATRREPTTAGLTLVDPRVEIPTGVAGELIVVACGLERGDVVPPIGDYTAYLSITAEERDTNGGRYAKLLRGRSGRVLFERMITRGNYPVLLWEAGETIADRYFIRIPRDFAPGRYVVAMDIQRVPFFQNRTLGGLIGDHDEYSRVRVGTIEVTPPVANS
ncbi:MAG: hypothetical protein ACKVU1_08755 [bacterium]